MTALGTRLVRLLIRGRIIDEVLYKYTYTVVGALTTVCKLHAYRRYAASVQSTCVYDSTHIRQHRGFLACQIRTNKLSLLDRHKKYSFGSWHLRKRNSTSFPQVGAAVVAGSPDIPANRFKPSTFHAIITHLPTRLCQ